MEKKPTDSEIQWFLAQIAREVNCTTKPSVQDMETGANLAVDGISRTWFGDYTHKIMFQGLVNWMTVEFLSFSSVLVMINANALVLELDDPQIFKRLSRYLNEGVPFNDSMGCKSERPQKSVVRSG